MERTVSPVTSSSVTTAPSATDRSAAGRSASSRAPVIVAQAASALSAEPRSPPGSSGCGSGGPLVGHPRTTMLTSRPPPAWMIRSGVFPPRAAMTFGRARTIASTSASVSPTATSTRSRTLPLTWTGSSRVATAAAAASTVGPCAGHGWSDHSAPASRQSPRPELLGHVRCRRRQHQQQEADGLVPGRAAGDLGPAVAEQQVRQLHELRDHRVEAEALVVGRHRGQRPVGRAADRLLGRGGVLAGRQLPGVGVARLGPVRVQGQRPGPVEEAGDAADPGRAPGAALVPGAHEHEEEAHGVGAVAGHQRVRILHVAPRLAHPLAVGAQDLALVEEPQERLAVADEAAVGHRLGEEAAVQQVHDGVLGAARVLLAPASSGRAPRGRPGRPPCRARGSGTSTTRSR